MPDTALLHVENLTASVEEKTILHQVNLDVPAGETHVLMGPNGAGKSTLGHLVMGDPVYTVNDGRIFFDGEDVTDLTTDKRSRAAFEHLGELTVELDAFGRGLCLRHSGSFL